MKTTKKPSRASRRAAPHCWPSHPDDADDLDALLTSGEMVLSSEPKTDNYAVAVMTHVSLLRWCIKKRKANTR